MTRDDAKELVRRLGSRADREGIETLNDDELTALIPWWARGVICNGGFRYFYEGGYDLVDVAMRLRRLGLLDAAAACERVSRVVFPNGRSQLATSERDQALAEVEWRKFERDEDVLFALEPTLLLDAIAKYVADHPAGFGR